MMINEHLKDLDIIKRGNSIIIIINNNNNNNRSVNF